MGILTVQNKNEIDAITSFLSATFHTNQQTDLLAICEDERLNICVDDYGNYFDGMLVWDNPIFHIHLNTIKGNATGSKKGRFTLAHELGHYFIDAHREGIRRGIILPHPSNSMLVHSERMEADYFASNLLLPASRLRQFTGCRKFSLDIIKEISEAFQVSLPAAIIRFAEVGTHGIMAVFCEGNRVKWYCKSGDFNFLSHKFKIDGTPPPTSVIGGIIFAI